MKWLGSWLTASRPTFRNRRWPPCPLGVEPLEDRLAPAALVNSTTLVYQDVDGDAVTVRVSKGTLSAANFAFDSAFASAGPQQLRLIELQAAEFQGASLKVTATP